jgi:hypothetical protein
MGYTHYFHHKKTAKKKWAAIVKDCKTLQAKLPKTILIDGCCAFPEPQFNDEEILFNGTDKGFTWKQHQKGEYPKNGHETFSLSQKGDRSFCKTARKSYDLLVCACLLVYKHHSPLTMELGSDGDNEDWADAENFVNKHLGYTVQFTEVETV